MKDLHTPIEPKQLHPMLLDDAHIGEIVAFDCRERMLTIQVDEMPNGKKPGHRLGARAILVFLSENDEMRDGEHKISADTTEQL